jgi:sulfate adenylyltransferase subunit 1 (EFTu-like GTPase family)
MARVQAAEQRRRQEQAWIADLTQRVSAWHQGNEILNFVDDFEKAGRKDSMNPVNQDQRSEWARSARAYATKLLEGSVRDPEILTLSPEDRAEGEAPAGITDRPRAETV